MIFSFCLLLIVLFLSSLEIFQALVKYESLRERSFETTRKVTKFIQDQATDIVKQEKLVSVGENNYRYKQHTGTWIYINTQEKTCECAQFYSNLVCKHLTAACIVDQIRLEVFQVFPIRLERVRRRRFLLINPITKN